MRRDTIIVVAGVLAGLVVALGVLGLGILVALYLPAREAAAESARRAICRNNLHQITVAMLNYENAKGWFPPVYTTDKAGKPLHSWRVLLLPYLEEDRLYRQIRLNEPWDSPYNRQFHSQVPRIFRCPSDMRDKDFETSYVVVVGPGGVFEPGKQIGLANIRAPSNTLMVVEASQSGINWMEPRDLDMTEVDLGINNPGAKGGIRSRHSGGACAAFCDGHIEVLNKDQYPPAKLRSMTSPRGGTGALEPSKSPK